MTPPASTHLTIAIMVTLLLCAAHPALARDYELLEVLPHQPAGFTQGLEIHNGRLYESSGLYQQSYVLYRSADKQIHRKHLPADLFAEGLTLLNDTLYLLTYKAGRCLMLDPESLKTKGEQRYRGEGWGLTNNGQQLIMSNGSSYLSFIDPDTWTLKRRVQVHYRGKPVTWLNELEWHNGLIVANQWQRNHLLVIDERSGQVLRVIDLSELYPPDRRRPPVDVMNGIAYDAQTETWLITGKYWPNLYRLRLKLPKTSPQPAGKDHQSSSLPAARSSSPVSDTVTDSSIGRQQTEQSSI